jgi:N-formylglutamate deformylase
MEPFSVKSGEGNLVLAMPHTGTFVPPDVWEDLNERGQALADTDWHLDRLYGGLVPDATIIAANFHRYVIDANRDPSGESLYPGQNTTGLCPFTDFEGEPIYLEGREPDEDEIAQRLALYHAPYHAALAAELERVRRKHGVVVLYDCHSIRSRIAFLFDGQLPDLNVGTNNGVTCASQMEQAVARVCAEAEGFTSVLNGRFRGGWTTRHYGRPQDGTHAIQMELAQHTHLQTEAAPFAYDDGKAGRLRTHLKAALEALVATASQHTNNQDR